MSRLIDADLLKRIICQDQCELPDGCGGSCEMTDYIKDAPTIEAVHVVRCKDCRYFEPCNAEEGDYSGHCRNDYAPCQNQTVDAWWFCGSAERVSE